MTDLLVMDQMLADNEVVPMIIVAPDPRVLNYDGSFWTDSNVVVGGVIDDAESFNNMFEKYIFEELIPFVDAKYRQKTTTDGDAAPFRAVMGQSMGGYGSLYYGIKYQEFFSAFAGDSSTAFWLINSNIASPPETGFPNGNPMFTFNKILIPELANSTPPGRLTPDNGDITFGFFAWAAAFSPIVEGIGPSNCTDEVNSCRADAPFCVTYPFVVGAHNVPEIVNKSFVEVPTILNIWQTYDPFVLLNKLTPEVLNSKAIYLDAGSDLAREPIDNVGAHYFSAKLNSMDVNNEFLLFDGGHTSCTTLPEIKCYRFTTNLKLFSGKFSEAGMEPAKMIITGDMTIDLADNSVMSITDKALLTIETTDVFGVPSTSNVTINITDFARLEVGNDDVLGGGLQVGNRFGKANIVFDTTRSNDSITFTLNINGPGAVFQIGKQGYLGFGMGINGNNTDVANYWGITSLMNVDSVVLSFTQGRFEHNQIASSLDERGSLFALGISKAYEMTLDPENFVISGGANLAKITTANRIHPTVQNAAGVVNPGGIRNRIVAEPATQFDDFYGSPKGLYISHTFSRNLMNVGILSSSPMLFDTDKAPLPNPATQNQLFTYLAVQDYFDQGRKRAPINELDGQLVVGYITPATVLVDGVETTIMQINRYVVDQDDPCNPLMSPFPTERILEEGAVGIALATIGGIQQVVRLYDLNPVV